MKSLRYLIISLALVLAAETSTALDSCGNGDPKIPPPPNPQTEQ